MSFKDVLGSRKVTFKVSHRNQAFNYLMEVNVVMEQGKPGCNREECIMLNAHFMMSPWGEPCYQDVWQEFSCLLGSMPG